MHPLKARRLRPMSIKNARHSAGIPWTRNARTSMARLEVVKQLAENSTRPLADYMHQPVDDLSAAPDPAPAR